MGVIILFINCKSYGQSSPMFQSLYTYHCLKGTRHRGDEGDILSHVAGWYLCGEPKIHFDRGRALR